MAKDKNRHIKFYKLLGDNIRKLRLQKDISQEELAFMISSARNYVGCIERAEKFPSLNTILDIAQALNCDVCQLLR